MPGDKGINKFHLHPEAENPASKSRWDHSLSLEKGERARVFVM